MKQEVKKKHPTDFNPQDAKIRKKKGNFSPEKS